MFLAYKSIDRESNKYEFFSLSGNIISSFEGIITESISAPIYEAMNAHGKYGLMGMDGKILLPFEFQSLHICPNGLITFTQIYDGIERMGGSCISDVTKTSVPCKFNKVEYSLLENCWKVQIHEYDSLLVYDENKQYDISFLDKGQRLFEEGVYEEARKYYSLDGKNAPWAKFFIGATYCKTVQQHYNRVNEALSILENSNNRKDRGLFSECRMSIQKINTNAEKANQTLQEYNDHNTRYSVNANEMLYELSEITSQVEALNERLDLAFTDYERRCSENEIEEKEEYYRQQEQLREQRQNELDRRKYELEQRRLEEQRLHREQKEREMRLRRQELEERQKRKVEKKKEEQKNSILKQNIGRKFNRN